VLVGAVAATLFSGASGSPLPCNVLIMNSPQGEATTLTHTQRCFTGARGNISFKENHETI
jgi:hypothetical protein